MVSGFQAVAFYGLEVPAGDEPTPVFSDIPGVQTIRITMAAIDPSSVPLEKDQPKLATLKIMRRALNDDYVMHSDGEDDEDDEEEEEEEKAPRGKSKKAAKKEADAAIKKALEVAKKNAEEMDTTEDKEDGSDDESEGGAFEIDEFVVCTLDPTKHCQQTLDFTINEEEEVFFKVIGKYDVSLTGNYVVPIGEHPPHDHDSDEDEDDYDLSPDEDELMYGQGDSESESEDELDNLENPRITEIDSEEEKKGKKSLKRAANDEPPKADEPEKKLSKKQLKKQKANDGKAVDTTTQETHDKKTVKFAKELEQGPSSSEKKDNKKAEPSSADKKDSGVKMTQGIKIEDKKVGTGPTTKNGSRVGMRYIGKLTNGKQFDANTKGKPFNFRLGKGEVIKGWDVGLLGMQVGGERRITIPANMAYGKKSLPGIPANSTLVFDVKLLEIK